MDPLTLTRIQAAGRLAFGAAMIAAPRVVGGGWIGADGRRDGATVITQALGIRDAALAVGLLTSAGGSNAKPWILAGVASDTVDLAATLRARDSLPGSAVAAVGAIASGSVALGLYLATR